MLCGKAAVGLLALAAAVGSSADLAADDAGSRPGEDPTSFQAFRSALVRVGHGAASGPTRIHVQWLGTGFLVDKRCTVVTAKHILQGLPDRGLFLGLDNPAEPDSKVTRPAEIIYEHPQSDLAFLRVSSALPGERCSSRGFAFLPLAREFAGAVLTGQEVYIAGFPALEGELPRDVPILRGGGIASSELQWEGRPMLLLDLTGVPGFSGAPVILRRTGEAIGVVFGPGRTERQYDLEWATPITEVDYRKATSARHTGQ